MIYKKILAVSSCAIALGSIGVASAVADVSFGGHQDYNIGAGYQPDSLQVVDLNQDGQADIVAARQAEATISYFLGNADGSFKTKSDLGTVDIPTSLYAGDLSGDGKPDLAFAKNDSSISAYVRDMNPNLSFAPRGPFALAGSRYNQLKAGYINNDKDTDLVTVDTLGNASVLLGGDANFFSSEQRSAVGGSRAFDLADINNDRKLDIVALSDMSGVVISYGDGSGKFVTQPKKYAAGSAPSDVKIVDINNDSKLDIILVSTDDDTTSVLLGNSTGFDPKQDFQVGNAPRKLTVADFNQDGKLDVVVANAGEETISVLAGTGERNIFESQQKIGVGSNPVSVVAADLNQDGRQDILISGTVVNGGTTQSVFATLQNAFVTKPASQRETTTVVETNNNTTNNNNTTTTNQTVIKAPDAFARVIGVQFVNAKVKNKKNQKKTKRSLLLRVRIQCPAQNGCNGKLSIAALLPKKNKKAKQSALMIAKGSFLGKSAGVQTVTLKVNRNALRKVIKVLRRKRQKQMTFTVQSRDQRESANQKQTFKTKIPR